MLSQLIIAQSDTNKDLHEIHSNLFGGEFEKLGKNIEQKFKKSNDPVDNVIGEVYYSILYLVKKDNLKCFQHLQNAEKIIDSTESELGRAYLNFGKMLYYDKIGIKEEAYKAFNSSLKVFSNYPNENFMLSQLYINQYKFKSLNKLDNFDKVIAFNSYNSALKSNSNILKSISSSNLGLYYFNEEYKVNKDSVNVYFNRAIDFAKKISNKNAGEVALNNAYLNFGYIMTKEEKFDINKFFKYYNPALKIAEKNPNIKKKSLPLIYTNIGYAYELNGDKVNSHKYYLKAYELLNSIADANRDTEELIIKNVALSFENKGDFKTALKFANELNQLQEKNSKNLYENNYKSLELFYDNENKNLKIKQLEKNNENFKKERLLYSLTGILILLISGLLIYTLKNKLKINKQKTLLLEAEKHETQLILELEKEEKARLKAEQELLSLQQEQLQKSALANSLKLEKKNTLINELKSKVEPSTDLKLLLKLLLKEDKLTDNDFEETENIIEHVHPNFFKKINALSIKKLTILDLKYTAYIYLNMGNQQIASILKVDIKTVRMTKYRLKQKFGLEKEVDLQKFIQNIDL